MAPGAPMNVSPFEGMIWLYRPAPRVCLPGANQSVVFGLIVQECARTVPLSSPAGMMTAPLGGDAGPPPRIALLPHTRTGGYVGPLGAGPAAEECRSVSASQVEPIRTITTAATRAARLLAVGRQLG